MEARTKFDSRGVPVKPAVEIRYDNATSGLSSTTAQAALDELASTGIAGGSIQASWNFSTTTAAADPGNKKFRANSGTIGSITALYFNDTTNGGFDAGTLLGFLVAGHRIYVQQSDDASRAALFQVSGPAVDNGGWWTVPVTVIASGTIYQNNKNCLTAFMLSINPGGVVKLPGFTVAGLPAGTIGDTAYVTDALGPAYLVAVVAGGAIKCPVFYNGAAWVAG